MLPRGGGGGSEIRVVLSAATDTTDTTGTGTATTNTDTAQTQVQTQGGSSKNNNNNNNNSNNNSNNSSSRSRRGVSVQLCVESFRLVGDRGRGVPKLNFDSLRIRLSLSLSLCLTFDKKKGWQLPASGFDLKILSFKGPYGINRYTLYICLCICIKPFLFSYILTLLLCI
ncbi:hypothetical protein B484DRAFT_243498 [Ochromonadaceae sp. CCMP2298]|nr:hypothetical protein B484DRAFT_243498 [Ochromonadaceae sp. CCMP2298]